jgi:hypothetical protein
MNLRAAIFAILLIACAPAVADESSSLGIKPNDPAAARENTRRVEATRTSIHFSASKFFFEIPVHYHPNGGKLLGEGGTGLRTAEAAWANDDNPHYTVGTRFVPTNPAADRDFLVLSGTGQKVSDIQIYGRRQLVANMLPTGPRARACIAIEARDQPPTGRHSISDCLLADADVAIATLATPKENHADLLYAANVYSSNCRAFFQSNNLQSVSHTFLHCFMENDGPMVGFELLRGGKIGVFSFYQNGPRATLVSVRDDCAPNANHVEIYDYQWDHVDSPSAYFCPLDSDKSSLTGSIVGHANNPQLKFENRRAGLLLNPRLKFDVANLGAVK